MKVTAIRTDDGNLGFKIEPENITDSNLLTEFKIDNVSFQVDVDNNLTTALIFVTNELTGN